MKGDISRTAWRAVFEPRMGIAWLKGDGGRVRWQACLVLRRRQPASAPVRCIPPSVYSQLQVNSALGARSIWARVKHLRVFDARCYS
jgi:hypothetical protein